MIARAGDVGKDRSGTAAFAGHWYQGKAEISRYELSQARYGQTHSGDAVLIFVTEDFLPKKQVKADGPRSRTGAWPILKMNFTKKFKTGIYPYSIMTSVFSPVDLANRPHTLKTSTTVQEWCGHTFLQLNLNDDRYRVRGYSYFQSEGDEDFTLDRAWLEDEFWTRIRLDPASLPTGKIQVIPGAEQHRLRHRPLKVEEATATLADAGNGLRRFDLEYAKEGRKLSITYQSEFPHRIEGWTETHSGRTTTARRTHTEMLPYWSRNGNADRALRKKLGLD